MKTIFTVPFSIIAIFLLIFAGIFLRVYVVALFIIIPLAALSFFEKRLSSWLKGGLVGTSILWPVGYVLLAYVDGFCSSNFQKYGPRGEYIPNQCRELIFKTTDFIPIPTFLGWFFTLVIGFVIGALVGLIIGKVKSRRT